jgi:uncharacterized membrane protein YukC
MKILTRPEDGWPDHRIKEEDPVDDDVVHVSKWDQVKYRVVGFFVAAFVCISILAYTYINKHNEAMEAVRACLILKGEGDNKLFSHYLRR